MANWNPEDNLGDIDPADFEPEEINSEDVDLDENYLENETPNEGELALGLVPWSREGLIFLRALRGWRQGDLAALLGVSQRAVSRWEAGETSPRPILRWKIDHLAVEAMKEVRERSRRAHHDLWRTALHTLRGLRDGRDFRDLHLEALEAAIAELRRADLMTVMGAASETVCDADDEAEAKMTQKVLKDQGHKVSLAVVREYIRREDARFGVDSQSRFGGAAGSEE